MAGQVFPLINLHARVRREAKRLKSKPEKVRTAPW